MKKIVQRILYSGSIIAVIMVLFSNCGSDLPESYEELENTGNIESAARDTYKAFFGAIQKLTTAYSDSTEAPQDSTLIKKVSILTDEVIEHVRQFPFTVESRIAMDALSYAAKDIVESPGISGDGLYGFWEYALIKPLFAFAKNYMNSHETNASAHLQLIKVLRRGMGDKATDEMVVDCITVVGPVPSLDVLNYCETDSLVFKKVRDLVVYSRSLQTVDPPDWMLSGDWFMSIDFTGLPAIYLAFSPDILENVPFLSFKDFNQGDVYDAVFEDPVPEESEKWDAWLARAGGVMNSLEIDGSIAERVKASGLPTADTHNFYDDYLFHTAIDSTKREFSMSLVRKKDQISTFEFAGRDSIAIIFTADNYHYNDGKLLSLNATRDVDASMRNNQYLPGQTFTGVARIMPLGEHDNAIVAEYKKSKEPKFDLDVQSPGN